MEKVDGDGGGENYRVDQPPPQNQDLSALSMMAGDFLSQFGWLLLLLCVLLYLLLQQHRGRRSSDRSRSNDTVTAGDAAAAVERRHEAMEASRRRMQEELDAKASAFMEKQKQQEEEKRKQKIEIWESVQQGKSYKGASRAPQTGEPATPTVLKPKTDKKPLRSTDYNPLSGDGGGTCSWRPGRRGPSSGG